MSRPASMRIVVAPVTLSPLATAHWIKQLAVLGKQRGVQVEVAPSRQVQHPLRNYAAVRHHNDGLRPDRLQASTEFRVVLDLFRLHHRQPRLLSQHFDGRRGRILIAPTHAIRLGNHELEVVTGCEQLLKVGMANCGVPQKTSLTRLPVPGPLQFANLAQHEIALQRTDAEDEENSVQVVDFMLEGPGQQVVRFPFKPVTLEILSADFYFGGARDLLPNVGQA